MSIIKSLMIPWVESQYTQEYIANVLWSQHLANVSSITLIPYIKNAENYSIAYIAIAEWCDTEAAYNFIQRLKNPYRETRLVHHSDDWWPIQLNTHNDDGNISVCTYTVGFDSDYFQRIEVPKVLYIDVDHEIEDSDSDSYKESDYFQRIEVPKVLYIDVDHEIEDSESDSYKECQEFIEKPYIKDIGNYYSHTMFINKICDWL